MNGVDSRTGAIYRISFSETSSGIIKSVALHSTSIASNDAGPSQRLTIAFPQQAPKNTPSATSIAELSLS